MGRRFEQISTAVEAISSLANLVFAARTDEGISAPYVLIGLLGGFAYTYLDRVHVGSFRTQPLRNVALWAVWIPTALAINRTMTSNSENASFAAGVSLGSLLARLAEP